MSEDSDDDWGSWTATAGPQKKRSGCYVSDSSQIRPPQPKARPRTSASGSMNQTATQQIPVRDEVDKRCWLEKLLEQMERSMRTAAAATLTSAAVLKAVSEGERSISPTTARFLQATADVVETEASVQRDGLKRVRELTSWPA